MLIYDIIAGMSESDMAQCNVILGIPTNPNFGSLNLAAAVQLIAYDWRMAIGWDAQ
jgi:tRNA/rRNA methyltransferase